MELKVLIKKELTVALYYLAATYIAVVTPYLASISTSDSINAINTIEAWKIVAPYIKSVLWTFVAFVAIRLIVVVLISYIRGAVSAKNS